VLLVCGSDVAEPCEVLQPGLSHGTEAGGGYRGRKALEGIEQSSVTQAQISQCMFMDTSHGLFYALVYMESY
jgi:hypothetical protein